MKLLNDFTDEELVNLTTEGKHTLYLLELAERGIPLPNAVPEYIKAPEDDERFVPDLTIFGVGSLWFKTSEEAEAIVNLAKDKALYIDYDWRNSSRTEYIGGRDADLSVTSKQVYSSDRYQEFKEEINLFEKRKNNVEATNNRRAEIVSNQQAVMAEIDDSIYEASKNVTRLTELHTIFEQYKKMANEDHEIAVRFLLNAHYSEVTDYDDERLAKIGLSRADIDKYNEASKPTDEENE